MTLPPLPAEESTDWYPHYAAIDAKVRAGSPIRDYRWAVPTGWTSIDEFNDDTLDPAWVRVDAAGGAVRTQWFEGGDSLNPLSVGTDGATELHGMMRPIAPMVVGDAIVTCITMSGTWNTNFIMSGLILADGVTYGSGAQVHSLSYGSSGGNIINDTRVGTGYVSSGSSAAINSTFGAHQFHRLVMTAANTWRTDISLNGVAWRNGGTLARTVTPTHAGVLATTWGTSPQGMVQYEFFRRMSGVT